MKKIKIVIIVAVMFVVGYMLGITFIERTRPPLDCETRIVNKLSCLVCRTPGAVSVDCDWDHKE
jgi:hypothetical protein